jgi:hypothetical protein
MRVCFGSNADKAVGPQPAGIGRSLFPLDETMSSYQMHWQRTEQLLAEAKTLLPPDVARTNATDLQQFDELMDANELGLAFEWLESITDENQPTCLPLLGLLRAASEEMNLCENLSQLDARIQALAKPLGE